jgi:hypothetical protein
VITPIFALDSHEVWRPVGVEESLRAVGLDDSVGRPLARLDFPPDMAQPDLPPVIYHEVIHEENLFWHRFWTWWLYNPKQYAGSGNHEGDWEYVAIGCCDRGGEVPVLLTYSQHHTGGKLAFWQAHVHEGRPIVYVARDSHANYFQTLRNIEDEADGRGPIVHDYELRESYIQPWWSWPGRWGNSTGEGKSPESPGNQRRHPALEWSRAR